MFRDRADAGRRLAAHLEAIPEVRLPRVSLVVLGLPRGGVPVAFEIANTLRAPLDVIVVRKLGVPSHAELAMGAIGEGDVRIVNHDVVRRARVDASEFAAVEARERQELARRAARFRGSRERVLLTGYTALIVDDGIATGSSAQAACQVARAQGAARVIMVAPIAPPSAIEKIRGVADETIVLGSPDSFFAIGQFYDDFTQTSDEEVVRLLGRRGSLTQRREAVMAGEFDVGAPTLQVNVYEGGRLITQIPCESAEEAAEVVAQWEAQAGFECEVEDLAVHHGPDDVLTPEPEDAFDDDDYRDSPADTESTLGYP